MRLALEGLPGVASVQIHDDLETVSVTLSDEDSFKSADAIAAIEEAGFEAKLKG